VSAVSEVRLIFSIKDEKRLDPFEKQTEKKNRNQLWLYYLFKILSSLKLVALLAAISLFVK